MKTWFWWLAHNVIAHPLMGVFQQSKWPVRLHDWTARRAVVAWNRRIQDEVELVTGHYVAANPLSMDQKACMLTDLMGMKSALYLVEEELGFRGHTDRFSDDQELSNDEDLRKARGHFLERFQVMLTEHFSEEEIDGLVEFYQSSIGQAYASKQAQTMKKMSDMMGRFVTELTQLR